MPKPKVGYVGGLSPAIAIEQKAHAGNPRSTVGTMTEIYDYLRVLYARIGVPHCPETGEVIKAISKEHVVDRVLTYSIGEHLHILSPLELTKQDRFEDLIIRLRRQGFLRIRLNKEFYTIENEADAALIPFDRKRKNELFLVVDRLKVDSSMRHRLFEAIEHAASLGNNKLVIQRENQDIPFNLAFAVESTGKSYPEITPHTFAFNNPEGMCPDCMGLGYQYGANFLHHDEFLSLSVIGLLRDLWQDHFTQSAFSYVQQFLESEGIDPHIPLRHLPIDKIQLFMQGAPEEQWMTSPTGLRLRWMGINQVLSKVGKSGHSELKESITPLLQEHVCLTCQGARIHTLAQKVTIDNLAIHELCRLPIEESLQFLQSLELLHQDLKILEEVRSQLLNRLRFLCEVGLHYLSLDRRAPTLSGGEAQRIRLARQLGSGLTGVLYVLDEPTIGLHPRDNARLNHALKQLKELGNTLLMVEHDPLTIQTADYILDFGPHSGEQGGHITAQGSLKQIMQNRQSLTGAYLSGRESIPIPTKRRLSHKGFLVIEHAQKNNLKNITVAFPIGVLTCLTGVSGSGKSTLLQQVLLPALEHRHEQVDSIQMDEATLSGLSQFNKVISIDQDPIGHTVRSDVGTYVEILPRMRDFFVTLPQARVKGLQPKHFSYNHRKGMCTACWGLGYRRIEMHFLPPVKVVCEDCQGMRLNPVSLEIIYAGKNFGQYLDSTVDEARIAFANHPRMTRILDTLITVGLGYLKLGQETASLSGGEAQRIKLSRELAKRSTGKTLYILDEPTTGLHSDDIRKLLPLLHRLVDKGNTMLIIEHHLDIIKNADYIIDLGPEAGEKGGYVICIGTPEEVAAHPTSWTGMYLKEALAGPNRGGQA
jgi:excinuclease ABC subunit A